jgi:secreted Zn-dependent insulinase-like peptidase
MARIIAHMMSEPFYHDLRTTQQLGYLVFSGQYSVLGATGLRWIVQSEKATVRYLEQQIMRFIDGFQGSLDRMSAETFEENRRAVVKERRERPVTLRAAVRRFKQEIRRRAYRWDRREEEARELERLDLASVRSFYRRLVGSDAERAILCSRARGNERKRTLDAEESTARVAVVKDLNQLKLTLTTFPAEAPVVRQ